MTLRDVYYIVCLETFHLNHKQFLFCLYSRLNLST